MECSYEECNKKSVIKGLCNSHNMQMRRRGYLTPLRTVNDAVARFWSKVDKSGDHWLWIPGPRDENGYGQFSIGTKKVYPHRYSFELHAARGISPGREIDHICRIKLCVRPEHLREVTRKENMTNRDDYRLKKDGKVICSKGHILAVDVTDAEEWKGRDCGECRKEWPSYIQQKKGY